MAPAEAECHADAGWDFAADTGVDAARCREEEYTAADGETDAGDFN
jgi:hypothetical protein